MGQRCHGIKYVINMQSSFNFFLTASNLVLATVISLNLYHLLTKCKGTKNNTINIHVNGAISILCIVEARRYSIFNKQYE
jgi:hypothetical protein